MTSRTALVATLISLAVLNACDSEESSEAVSLELKPQTPLSVSQCWTTEKWDVIHPKFQLYCEDWPLDEVQGKNSLSLETQSGSVDLPAPGESLALSPEELGRLAQLDRCQLLGIEGLSEVECIKDCTCSDSCTDTDADWSCTATDPTAMDYFGRGDHQGFGGDILIEIKEYSCPGSIGKCKDDLNFGDGGVGDPAGPPIPK